MSYSIELKYQAEKPRQSTFLHLITGFALVGIGAFTFLLADTNWIQTVFHAAIIPSYLLATLCLSYGLLLLFCVFARSKWLQITDNSKKIRLTNTIITIILALVFALSQWWLAAGIAGVLAASNLFAYFYEQRISQAAIVSFDEKNIQMPHTARRKQLEWTEVERITLRHGTITIDCTNNVLYQWTIKYNTTDTVAFEAFCTKQIENNLAKRDSNDW